MRVKNFSQDFVPQITKLAAPLVLSFCISSVAAAQKEATVHTFKGGSDGAQPVASLISDSAGNLYGTTSSGGGSPNCGPAGSEIGCGTVFELTPPSAGVDRWTETVLYAFQGETTDGAGPAAPLVFDASGNLYGTTRGDGQNNHGVIFELSPPADSGGAWTETVLYNFAVGYPTGGLAVDSDGNLYGETTLPEVYELSPPSAPGGAWTFTDLKTFTTEAGGESPIGGLALDKKGNLYGTSSSGGNGASKGCPVSTCGLVFELVKPTTGSTWKERVLYNFTGQNGDGATPYSGVVFHGENYLYGTTINGGNGTQIGTVFELSFKSGTWTETILYDFNAATGRAPMAGVVFDPKGNLYSTLYYGLDGGGEVFELSPPAEAGNPWTYTDLFDSNCGADGCYISTGLLLNKAGVLYGTTQAGGTSKDGVVFSVIP
jgi:uncharacterized repeat protein (TIGR03803 family)